MTQPVAGVWRSSWYVPGWMMRLHGFRRQQARNVVLGLHPGPLLIKESPNVFWGLVASMYVGNAMLLILNLPAIPVWVRMLKINYVYLFTMILLFCLFGAYSLNNNAADVLIMTFFGFIGYFLRKLKFEIPPLILAFVLGPMLEPAFRRSLILSHGSFGIFLSRPISAIFLTIAFISLVLPLVTKKRFGSELGEVD